MFEVNVYGILRQPDRLRIEDADVGDCGIVGLSTEAGWDHRPSGARPGAPSG
jgi:hypothetical protein